MSALSQRDARPPDRAAGWQDWPLAAGRPADAHSVPVEDYLRDGQYVLQAELPGMDPEWDIEVTVTRDILTIRAERLEDPAGRAWDHRLWPRPDRPWSASAQSGRQWAAIVTLVMRRCLGLLHWCSGAAGLTNIRHMSEMQHRSGPPSMTDLLAA